MNTLVSPSPPSPPSPRWLPLARWLASSGYVGPTSAGFGAALALAMLATGRPDGLLCVVTWLLVFASYRLDAAGDASPAGACDSARSRHLRRGPACGLFTAAAALVLALGLAAGARGAQAALLLLVFPLSVVFYGLPWLRWLSGGRWRSACVKDIPGAKSLYTAFFWGLFGLYAWWFAGGALAPPALAGAFALLALRFGFNTLLCDLKDIERDRAAGVVTVATRLGRAGLLRMLTRVESLWPLLLLGLVALQWLPPLALMLALTTVYTQAVCVAAARRLLDDETLCNLVADAEMLLWPAFLALGLACGLGL